MRNLKLFLLRPAVVVGVLALLSAIMTSLGTSSWPTSGPDSAAAAHLFAPVRPLMFERNQGQTDERIDFLSHGDGSTLFLSAAGLDISMTVAESDTRREVYGQRFPRFAPAGRNSKSSVVRMRLHGANPRPGKTAIGELPGRVNYLMGNDPGAWQTNVVTYEKVQYEEVYPGIDLVYYGNQRDLEYDFVVAAGADPQAIALNIEGTEDVAVEPGGDLRLRTAEGALVELHRPVAYQEKDGIRQQIAAVYQVDRRQVTFQIGAYDSTRPLIIDPVIGYSTRLGGKESSSGQAIAVDAAGNVYVTGDTNATDFPVARPWQRKSAGATDIFVSKLSPDGRLLYSTYLGGSGADVGYGIAVDGEGNIYLTGDTASPDFPLAHPLQSRLGGIFDAFVAKLSPDGARLIYSTYIGGSSGDRGQGIAVDGAGNAYVAGYTYSTDFPVASPLQKAFTDNNVHGFVLKLAPAGTELIYSTYLGGGNDRPDMPTGIAADAAGNAYVTGFTNSVNFPSVHAIQSFAGPTDAFVTKINATGSAFVYSTHLGGNADDEGMAIAVDASGSAYVTGETESLNFPTTSGAYSQSCTGVKTRGAMEKICSGGDLFVSKLSPDGSSLLYSTYINGSGFEVGRGIAIDAHGNAYIAGLTTSPDLPMVNAVQKNFGGGEFDAFAMKLNASGSALMYSTYLGGSARDGAHGIALDKAGNAFVTGYTYSQDFPTRNPVPHGPRRAAPDFRDAFVTRITDNAPAQ
jgi:hypothetical protein